jgi:phage terminase large subunit-like protein
MPWQQYVADVALEIDPATGRLAYTELGLTVPRQSGKSTFIEAKATHRCSATGFFGPRQRVVYTAQTRAKAREKWEEDFLGDLKTSRALKGRIRPHLGNGNEHIRFANGSKFGLEAGTEKAGHGGTLDECYIDEAFAQPDWRLEQAFGPAMITRRNKLLAWISTAGWLGGSFYLADKVELGRIAVAEGRQRGLAYFEWSADPDDDPADPAGWQRCMPALGHTITEDDIRAEYLKARDAGKLNEFDRAYRNLWVPKLSAGTTVIDPRDWRSAADPDSQMAGQVAIGFNVGPDLSCASVAVAGRRADGLGHGELVEHRQGTGWLVGRLMELAERWGPCAVVLNPATLAASVEKELLERGLSTNPGPGERRLHVVGGREYAQACVALVKDVIDGRFRHLGQSPLDDAVRDATRRRLADSWAFDAKEPGADISPLVAVALARHGFMTHGVTPPPEPFAFWA